MQHFDSDYMEGAHPQIMQRLLETNMEKTPGYGCDAYSDSAKEKIRKACGCPGADVHFLVGGTQTNAIVIKTMLRPYQGVISVDSGHIACHEAGAIEAGGHKVLAIPGKDGKLVAEDVKAYIQNFYADDNYEHMVNPGMVYISHPTEYGTLYTKAELEALHKVCEEFQLPLYLDGARLGYGLAAKDTDVTLETVAANCDAFYIGGTKVGAMFGEAVVVTRPALLPHFFTVIKQEGALLAKGRLLGIQFDTLFSAADDESESEHTVDLRNTCDCSVDNDVCRSGEQRMESVESISGIQNEAEDRLLYVSIADHADRMADKLRSAFREKGYQFFFETTTNQIFIVLENSKMKELQEKVTFSFWERTDEDHTVVRFATSWGTREEDVDALIELL